jgi:hypothetical protein
LASSVFCALIHIYKLKCRPSGQVYIHAYSALTTDRVSCSAHVLHILVTATQRASRRQVCRSPVQAQANGLVGDLGVQRGVVRWFYHWHNPERHSDSVPLSPHKLPGPSKPKVEANQSGDLATVTIGGPTLPSTPNKKRQRSEETVAVEAPIPPPFTPSIKRTLDKGALGGLPNPPGLPSGLSLAELKARLSGKKVKYVQTC